MFSVRETGICSSASSPEGIAAKTTEHMGSLHPVKYSYMSHVALARTANTAGGSE